MSRRRDIEATVRSFREIRDILNAMKNMALMEVHRLGRFLATQQRVVAAIEAAGSDFSSFYPELFPRNESWRDVYVLLGSERGFCGDFNELLLRALAEHKRRENVEVVVVGSKLYSKLPRDFRVAAFLEGASVVDEIENVLVRLMNTVSDTSGLAAPLRALRVTAFHHRSQGEGARVAILQPFQEPKKGQKSFAYPPRLYLDPAAFAKGLVEQYLFARLHELLYSSLMVENQVRVQHMDAAVQRLDRKSTELLRRRNMLRQEEITEEIEVIMLSAGSPPRIPASN
jgi:F-type H+-transporting ATPase subunit gamma